MKRPASPAGKYAGLRPLIAADRQAGPLATFLRYCIGGGMAVAIHFGVLTALVEILSFDPTIATAIGFLAGTVFNYCFQYYFTFRAESAHAGTFARYFSVTLLMMGVNVGLFWAMTEKMSVPYLYAQAVATCVVMFCNFSINKNYTFKNRT